MPDLIVKWRNASPETVVELVHEMPQKVVSESEYKVHMNNSMYGPSFLKTCYQLAAQLGLYYINKEGKFVPRFNRDISLAEAREYLEKWITRYYVPNPYTASIASRADKQVHLLEKSIYELAKQKPYKTLQELCDEILGVTAGNVPNIKYAIKNFSKILEIDSADRVKAKPIKDDNMLFSMDRSDRTAFFNHFSDNGPTVKKPDDNSPLPPAVQKIFYGVPGCGKSTMLKAELPLLKVSEPHTKRVVFHPDYSFADFVGQILPESDEKGDIKYKFKAGPFTEILHDAYNDQGNAYALIIEEINRGNAAAIFGEVFQLLDRKREGSKADGENGKYGYGWSDYSVHNENLRKWVGFPEKEGVRLPPNLSILATMNTSDQNVFSLDNAFQRRWNMQLVSNKLSEDSDQYKMNIEGVAGICWGKFRSEVNLKITQSAAESGLSSLEDKRLGAWFILADKPNNLVSKDLFSNKVLKYLWDDAFKMERSALFRDCQEKTLEDVIDDFKAKNLEIFTEDFVAKLGTK